MLEWTMFKRHFSHCTNGKPHQSCLKVTDYYFSTFADAKLKWLWWFSKSLVTNASTSGFLALPWDWECAGFQTLGIFNIAAKTFPLRKLWQGEVAIIRGFWCKFLCWQRVPVLQRDLLSEVHIGIALLFLGIHVNLLKCSRLQWPIPWKRMEDIWTVVLECCSHARIVQSAWKEKSAQLFLNWNCIRALYKPFLILFFAENYLEVLQNWSKFNRSMLEEHSCSKLRGIHPSHCILAILILL